VIQESLERLAEIEVYANPFPGLRPFEFHESHLFFGREGQSRQLMEKLGRTRFLAVVGASGGGKSSLVRAGLLPDLYGGLMKGAGSNWRMALMRPGDDPIGNLARELNSADAFGPGDDMRIATTEATLRRGNLGLIEVARQAGMKATENLIVVADQFEELFRIKQTTQEPALHEERANDNAAFVKLLLEAAAQRDLKIYVTLTMRSDYLGECAQFQDLPETINESQYLIPRLTREQRRLAITGPVAVGGAEIAPRLVTQLLNDAGDNPDQLPILQHALMRTWEKWERERTGPLDLHHYQAVGTTAQALSLHAEEAFGALHGRQPKIAETLFKRLTEKVADNRESRRPATVAEIRAVAAVDEPEILEVIEVFREAGRSFLTTSPGGTLKAESLIDISHESLIRGWRRLKDWVDEEAQSARIYKRLAATAVLHVDKNSELWRGSDLREALAWSRRQNPNADWAQRYHPDFKLAKQFLEESRNAVWRRYSFGAALALLGLVVLFYAWGQQQAAQEQKKANRRLYYNTSINFAKDAFARGNMTLGHGRLAEFLDDPDGLRGFEWYHFRLRYPVGSAIFKGQGVPLQSIAFAPDGKRLAMGDTSGVLQLWEVGNTNASVTLPAHEGEVSAVAYSMDGQSLATGGADGKLKWWKLDDKQPVWEKTHGTHVRAVALALDGKRLVSGSDDGTLKLWDAGSGQELTSLRASDKAILAVAASPDGTKLASAGEDGWVRLWDANSGREIAKLERNVSLLCLAFAPDGARLAVGGKNGQLWLLEANSDMKEQQIPKPNNMDIWSVAFSRNGRRLAAGSGDGIVRLWETGGSRDLAVLKAHTARVTALAFSPVGETLASASVDGTLKLWEMSAGQDVMTLKDHSLPVRAVAYFPDGRKLASASEDGTVKLWDIAAAKMSKSLTVAGGTAWSLAVSPDGKRLASGGADGTVRLWEAQGGLELNSIQAHAGKISAVAFSPDGKQLASAGEDGKVILSDVLGGKAQTPLKELGTSALAVAFSPDGTRLAGGIADGSIMLWETGGGRKLNTLNGHTDEVKSVVFSRDGKKLASASMDWAIKVWDAVSGQELMTLSGHGTPVLSVAFSPDGQRLASGGADGRVKLWETVGAQELVTLPGPGAVWSLVFSPDGTSLASGGQDSTIALWFAAPITPVQRGK
jgi:WD40 repeat protein